MMCQLYQHLVGAQAAVAVQIYALEPVVQADVIGLVLLAQDKVHKVLVAHLAIRLAGKRPGSLPCSA